MLKHLVVFFSLLFLATGCVVGNYHTNPAKYKLIDIDKPFFINRGMWWNYYQKGLALMERGKWDEAIVAFKEAESKLSEDRISARTYGMHRIDYFVNRELGIAYYLRGIDYEYDYKKLDKADEDYEEAKKYLIKSFKKVKSTRAQFYLKELFRKRKSKIKEAPEVDVKILSPKKDQDVNIPIIKLKVKITDQNFIDSVWINGDPLYMSVNKDVFEFEKVIKLSKETKEIPEIKIEASNFAGIVGVGTPTVSSKQFKIKSDRFNNYRKIGNYQFVCMDNNVLKEILRDTINDESENIALFISPLEKDIMQIGIAGRNQLLSVQDVVYCKMFEYLEIFKPGNYKDFYTKGIYKDTNNIKQKNIFDCVQYKRDKLNQWVNYKNGNKGDKIKIIQGFINKELQDKKVDVILKGQINFRGPMSAQNLDKMKDSPLFDEKNPSNPMNIQYIIERCKNAHDISEWSLNMMPAIDEPSKQEQIDKFKSEPKKNKRTVLIVEIDTVTPISWTIAIFNDEGELINRELIDDANNELARELRIKDLDHDKDSIIELATLYLGLNRISGYEWDKKSLMNMISNRDLYEKNSTKLRADDLRNILLDIEFFDFEYLQKIKLGEKCEKETLNVVGVTGISPSFDFIEKLTKKLTLLIYLEFAFHDNTIDL